MALQNEMNNLFPEETSFTKVRERVFPTSVDNDAAIKFTQETVLDALLGEEEIARQEEIMNQEPSIQKMNVGSIVAGTTVGFAADQAAQAFGLNPEQASDIGALTGNVASLAMGVTPVGLAALGYNAIAATTSLPNLSEIANNAQNAVSNFISENVTIQHNYPGEDEDTPPSFQPPGFNPVPTPQDKSIEVQELGTLSADTSSAADSADTSAGTSSGDYSGAQGDSDLQAGGQIKGYQEGDLVVPEQADTELDIEGLGPMGLVDDIDGEQVTGVADDLEMQLPEGSYVLNAHTVELVGVRDLNEMVKEAISIAIESDLPLPKEVDATDKVPIKISNGEFVIPAVLVPILGVENLEKMNKRGLEYRDSQKIKEEEGEPVATAPETNESLAEEILPTV